MSGSHEEEKNRALQQEPFSTNTNGNRGGVRKGGSAGCCISMRFIRQYLTTHICYNFACILDNARHGEELREIWERTSRQRGGNSCCARPGPSTSGGPAVPSAKLEFKSGQMSKQEIAGNQKRVRGVHREKDSKDKWARYHKGPAGVATAS